MNGRKISFDGWVLDRESGDLSRDGARQRLQELPLKVLDLLLANPGGLVTREQLIAHLWPKGVVDFDTGLNTAVRKLRVALADDAEAPRYIETIPRRGYRFIGTVESEAAGSPEASDPVPVAAMAAPAMATSPPSEFPVTHPSQSVAQGESVSAEIVDLRLRSDSGAKATSSRRVIAGIAGLLVLGVCGAYLWRHRPAPLPAVESPTAPALAAPALTPALPAQSVAVLPFENLSTEPNNEFLALGIAEAVLHRLSSLHELTVIARTSSFAFKNRNEDVRQIGRSLNARYLVEGSVQRAGESLRVHAQLIDAGSGSQVWSLTFDRKLADIFALQDEISGKVAEHLSGSVTPVLKPAIEANTSNLDAYLTYLQGRALVGKGTIADAERAVQAFERAAQLDPTFAAAYAQQSRALMLVDASRNRNDPAIVKRAMALNDRALSLDPRLGEAWVQRADLIREAGSADAIAEAENAFKKGLALAPNYGQGFESYANFLWFQNRRDEALSIIERARQVDPLTPRNHYLKALLLDYVGKADAAEVESLYLQALKLNPTYHPALVRLGGWYTERGEYARALALQEAAIRVEPESGWVRDETAATYLAIGHVVAAGDVLGAGQGPASAMWICVLMLKGDHAAALAKAYEIFGHARHPDVKAQVSLCAVAEIMRDALATGKYERALHLMESQYAIQPGELRLQDGRSIIWGLSFAQLLLAAGQNERAHRILHSIQTSTERETAEKGLPPWLPMVRAATLTLLGDRDRALDALENSIRDGMYTDWWAISRGTTFDSLKQDARYKALDARAAEVMRKQRELVEKMRMAGDLPRRPEMGG